MCLWRGVLLVIFFVIDGIFSLVVFVVEVVDG